MSICIKDDDDRSTDKDVKNASAINISRDPPNPIFLLQPVEPQDGPPDVASNYTMRHQNALLCEVSILETVLRRNSDAHAKTKYFRHSTCALRRLLNPPFAVPNLYEYCVTMMEQFDSKTQKLRKKIRDDIHTMDIDFEQILELKTLVVDLTEGGLSSLFSRATTGLTECRQRIEATYRYCRQEIQRGFFLPLLTIIAACWARIYTICIRLQIFVMQSYVRQCYQLSSILSQYTNSMTTKEINTQKRYLSERIYVLKEKCMETLSNLPKESLVNSSCHVLHQSTTSFSRMERTEQALRHIGLQSPNFKTKPVKYPNLSRTSMEPSAELNSCAAIVTKDTYVSTVESMDLNNGLCENDDTGERLVNLLPTVLNLDTSLGTVSHASAPSIGADNGSLVANERIDQNDIIVQRYQKNNKKRASEKLRSTSAKKKRKEPDFFDQLFK